MGNLTNSKDPDEIQHNAAFHQGLHCLLLLRGPLRTTIHHNLESLQMHNGPSSPILIVLIGMGKSIKIQRKG